jgi:uncharacterized membrane protein
VLITAWQQPTRALAGATTAAFLIAVFPGNISQYRTRTDALGLDSDRKRAVRLVFQPLGVALALGVTEAVRTLGATGAVRTPGPRTPREGERPEPTAPRPGA